MKRGRPKGRSNDNRSFGPLGDLIRTHRLNKGLGLLDVAKACQCSVQFVSNIEHGRAPLPWEKVTVLASVLKIPVEELQAANLAIRSDFKSFVTTSSKTTRGAKGTKKQASHGATAVALAAAASSATLSASFTANMKDAQILEVLQRYQAASSESRRKFVRAAMQMLS